MRQTMIHILLWVLLITLLFTSFGQRLRADDSSGQLIYSLSYDFEVLLIIIIDVIVKAILFYSIIWFGLTKKESTFINHPITLFLISMTLSLLLWFLFQVIQSYQTSDFDCRLYDSI